MTGGQVALEVSGIALIKARAEIARRIGPENVTFTSADGLRFDAFHLPAIIDLTAAWGADPAVADKAKSWERHAAARTEALSRLKGAQPTLSGSWNEVLDAHQALAVAALSTPGLAGGCLFDEQGSGKTVMAIALFDVLREMGLVDTLFVLCPKTMIGEWRGDFEKLLPKKYSIASIVDEPDDTPAGLAQVDVYLTNFEGLARVGMPLGIRAESKRALLVVDESFFLKNASAERTRRAMKLRAKCSLGIVLCGTPAPNSYHDIISQFNLADGGYTFSGFRDQGRDSVASAIEQRGLMIRRLKRDILPELAEKSIAPVIVQMRGRQRALYARARDSLVLYLKTLDNRALLRPTDGYFAKLTALLQICSWPQSIDPTFDETPAKVAALDELLDTLIVEQGKKVVLWTAFVDPIHALAERYEQHGAVIVSGATSQAERTEAVRRFQNDAAIKLFIANPAAAGAGITLTAASDAVFFSFSNRAADFLQAIDRIHRRGQAAERVTIWVLLAAQTIEGDQFDRLLAKERDQGQLLRERDENRLRVEEAIEALTSNG